MTPERLEEIRRYVKLYTEIGAEAEIKAMPELLDYIDLLHEDLRITRAERDAEKKKNMKLRKDTR